MFKNLNLPNKLTLIRIILVPIFIILISLSTIENIKWVSYIALAVYIIASITDFIDGRLARKNNMITDFGKIMDPLADKMLVASSFIMLTYLGGIPGWITAIVVCRDFFVDGLRMLCAKKVVPASISGKIKTFFQMATMVLALTNYSIGNYYGFLDFIWNYSYMNIVELFLNVFMAVCLIGTIIATVASLIDYILKFNKILSEDN